MITNSIKSLMMVTIILGLSIMLANIVLSVPSTPNTIAAGSSETRTFSTTGYVVEAEAGNVTQLTIDGTKGTSFWQGYFGNVTGIIKLDDGENFTMYDWNFPSPSGEVYAANSTVDLWTGVKCINLTSNRPGNNCANTGEECLNKTEIENYYGMGANDGDGVDETFTAQINLTVGTVSLTNCAGTYLNENNTDQTLHWKEAMITINNTETIIFTSILENNAHGFDNRTYDFQMIVVDKSSAGTTSYWFYVELA